MEYEDKHVGIILDRVPIVTCRECGCQIDVSGINPFTEVVCPSCDHAEPVPARLGPFLLYHLIGTGGMGGIYYARDESLGRFVAVKVMLKSLGEDREFVESFKREAQAAAQLNHPHIAQIYSFGQEKGQPYIVMELVSGEKFAKMVESPHPLDPGLVMKIGLEVAEGLQAASEANLVHGDIKPENILLDEKLRAKLVDFGLASFVNQQAAEGIWGTPYYIAPEKVRRQPADERSDIYSLGATLYHAVAGRPPFEGETPMEVVKARLGNAPDPLTEVRPGIDEEIERIVMRMLDPEPTQRYPTYASLISDLKKAMQALAPKGGYGPKSTIKSKKVVIKKKSAPRIRLDNRQTDEIASGAHETLEEYRRLAAARTGRSGRKAALIILLVFISLFLLAAGGGTAAYFAVVRKLRLAARRDMLALQGHHEAAERAYAEIQDVALEVVALGDDTHGLVERATNAVFVVLGETIELAPARKKPAPPPPEPPDEQEPPEEPADTAPAPAPTETAPAPRPPPVSRSKRDSGIPEGILTPEELRLRHEQADVRQPGTFAEPKPEEPEVVTATTDSDNVAAATEAVVEPGGDGTGDAAEVPGAADVPDAVAIPDEEPPEEEAVPPEPIDDRPMMLLARAVISSVQGVRDNVEAAREAETRALAKRDAVVDAPLAQMAEQHVTEIRDLLASITDLKADAQAFLRAARDALDEMIETEGKTVKAQREEARRLAEEAERRRLEAETQAKIEAELGRVREAEEAAAEFARTYRYPEAVKALTDQVPSFETEDGARAIKLAVDRYVWVGKLKSFAIESVNRQPYRWGWGQGRSKLDILGADENGLRITGGRVAWPDIKPSELPRIVNHYTGMPDTKRRIAAEQYLAMAVYFYLNDKPDLARTYKQKSISTLSLLEEDALRLIPE